MSPADILFLAHYVGGGIDPILDMTIEDFYTYLAHALDFYEKEITTPRRVILSGIEKR